MLNRFLDEMDGNCLLLARHGETDWNAMGLLQGQQDRPLSIKGFQQRKRLFFLLCNIPLGRIVTSSLQRTIQTALPLSDEKEIPIEQIEDFNEARLGVFEGEHKRDFSDNESQQTYTSFLQDEINICLPGGGENLKMVNQRVKAPILRIVEDLESSGHVLIVAHRNVNKMIVKNLLGLSFDEGYGVEHLHDCLYIFSPENKKVFHLGIPPPNEPCEILQGYVEIS